jgi:multidrug efflux system outer membrane protein
VAYASRFPRITLTGQWGYRSDDLSDLFDSQSELWNMAAGLVQPLFDFGKRKAAQRAAQARFIQGQVDYARTVLSAFADVESALLTRQQQLQRRQRVLIFLSEARATQKTAQQRYERGLVDYLTVLEAQQVRFRAELELIQVEKAIYQNRVALHRALGGGWG